MEILAIFMSIISPFAFQPWLCGLVASAFTIPIFVSNRSIGSKVVLGIAACAWWGFTWLEATTSVQANIRLDLALLSPFLVIAAVLGIWALFAGPRRNVGDRPMGR